MATLISSSSATAAASPTSTSATSLVFNHLSPPLWSSIPRSLNIKAWGGRRLVLLRVNCSGKQGEDEEEEELNPVTEITTKKTDVVSNSNSNSNSASSSNLLRWCAGVGGIGFLETGYLTFLKLTNSDAFCPIASSSSCNNILNSQYALLFGVPLPLIGMIAYGLVTTLALQLHGKDFLFNISDNNARLLLLAATTSMATASTYFLYILTTQFSGDSCAYCLLSALLSFTLLFISIKASAFQDIRNVLGLQLCAATLVVTALSTSYSSIPLSAASLAEPDLQFFTTEITTQSSSFAISLAKHLHSVGAKMYGAFWCSHCIEQKQMFGHEAAKFLDYVECFPDGYKKGVKIANACASVGIEGFPTWVIDGQVLSGELELPELARVSGFETNGFS